MTVEAVSCMDQMGEKYGSMKKHPGEDFYCEPHISLTCDLPPPRQIIINYSVPLSICPPI